MALSPFITHAETAAGGHGRSTAGTRTSMTAAVASDVIVVAGILVLFGTIAWMLPDVDATLGPEGPPSHISTDPANLPYYTLRSLLRMAVALLFSLIFTFIYGLAAARLRRVGKVLTLLLDILQSVPVLGFLSATITIWITLFPHSMLGVEAASVFAIFTSQAWNMTFSFRNSLLTEPQELDEAARSFRLTRWQRFWKLDVPNSTIPLLWNCMMSVSGGWFFLTASEMISVNNTTYALPGIGSFVEESAANRELGNIGLAIVAMILVVLLIDIGVWRPLIIWSQKFRNEQSSADAPRSSLVLNVIRRSHIDDLLGAAFRPIGEALDVAMRPLGRTGARWPLRGAGRRAGDVVFAAACAGVLIAAAAGLVSTIGNGPGLAELGTALYDGGLTFLRVAVLTLVCSVIWVPIGASIGMNPRLSRMLQPLIQILSSFPANFVFPLATLVFIAWGIDINWGSILLMALGAQWYILFNVIAGANSIPSDLVEMTRNLGVTGFLRWRTLILPSVFGAWCEGGITAAGGAWNASIVSEVVSYGNHTLVARGLGSYITQATESGQTARVVIGVAVMSAIVVIVNRVFWAPLQRLASRRFSL
ncbi:ABC transporter permease [Bifidobacterium minimum]|uniref:ABC transporter permease n=2 Tax=Bifidobacterium minimum TaxID=1693 RepID=A0A087BR62_9BIFI|nr:ABC transporter permease [Bifidobacterium minimum]